MIPISLAHEVRFNCDIAEARAGRDVDLQLADLLRGLFIQHGLVCRDARLSLGVAALRRHPDPLELALQRFLALRFRLFFLPEAILFLLEPGGVVPLPWNALAAIELQDPSGHVVEK